MMADQGNQEIKEFTKMLKRLEGGISGSFIADKSSPLQRRRVYHRISFFLLFFSRPQISWFIFYNVATGLATLAVLGTDYTISGTVNAQGLYPNGGTVNMTVAPTAATATAGQVVVIFRNPAFKQNYALLQNGNISSAALVQQMDYLTLLCQRLEDQTLTTTASNSPMELAKW